MIGKALEEVPLALGPSAQEYLACHDGGIGSRITFDGKTKEHRWIEITSFQFIYSMINTGMALCVLPEEADRLNQGAGSLWVGIYLGIVGATQLVNPLAGRLSDRHCSQLGRRRPFILGGTFVALVCFVLLRISSQMLWPYCYMAALGTAMIGMNFAYAAQCGLPADIYSENGGSPRDDADRDTVGIVSSLVAVHSFLGSLAAITVIIATNNAPVYIQYTFFMIMLVACCAVVCNSANEENTENSSRHSPMTFSDVLSTFMIDLNKDRDFFWVLVGRLFYYMSTCPTVFLMYYIRDMVGINSDADIRVKLATLMIVAQLMGAAVSVPAGRTSNNLGRKPVICAACLVMSFTYLLYIWAPTLPQDERWQTVLVAGVAYGLGSGIYLSVDYALALDCLPAGKSTAEAFGLWGVAGFFGSTAGPILGGIILALNPSDTTPAATATNSDLHYSYRGYTSVMLGLGVFMNIFVILATYLIRGTR